MATYKKIHISILLKYYKREEIQQAILNESEDKEIAVSYGGTGYGKRPDTIQYPRDVLEMVKKGATSFHCSEELWKNPLQITTGMKPQELNEIRKGWDLILDIDCKELEYSKIAGDLIVHALKHHGIKNISVKFSGNHGFHIGIPYESFPETVIGKPVKDLFPEGPKKIAMYLQDMIKEPLTKKMLDAETVTQIAERAGKQTKDLIKNGQFNPFEAVSIDTILIATRHLYRMPYSLNEKSGLVSTVIKPEEILKFNKEDAQPEKVTETKPFLNRNGTKGEARKLLVQAFDHKITIPEIEVKKQEQEYEPIAEAIPETHFPPCIQEIAKGLTDGRKRAVLILINFLSSIGWEYKQIENYLEEWNKRNQEPLREVYLTGQLRHHKSRKKQVLPPNCDNKAYMIDLRVCKPDGFCPKIKNPVNYAIAKDRMSKRTTKKPKKEPKNTTSTKAL